MTLPAGLTRDSTDALPLHVVTRADYAEWRGAQPAAVGAWLDAQGFDGSAYTAMLVPDTGGSIAAGEALLRRPAHSGRLAAAWRPGSGSTLSASVLFTGARDDLDFSEFPARRVSLPAYQVVDLSVDVELPGARTRGVGVALLGRLENALDAEYETVLGYPGRARTLYAGARVSR